MLAGVCAFIYLLHDLEISFLQVNADMMWKRYFEYCDFVFVPFFSD